MTTTDPFEYDDAAYVLGALTGDERRAFETHLQTCADCRARVDDLRSTADLLRTLPGSPEQESEVEAARPGPVPDTLLPGLLHRASRERRRRWLLTSAIGAVAASLLVALAVVVWPETPSTPSRPPAQALSAVRPNPLTVTARLVTKAWGTEIELHCTYPSYENERFAYGLVVIDRHDLVHDAGDWTLVPGKDGITFTTGTAVQTGQIKQLQVRTASGLPLLQLDL